MDYQNTSTSPSSRKIPKRTFILLGVIGILILGVIGFFIFNKTKAPKGPAFIDDASTQQIERGSIPGSSEFKKDGITFSYPSDYELEETKIGYYVIYKPRKSKELESGITLESGINIDSRRQGENANFSDAVNAGRNNLVGSREKQIPSGVKMYGTIKEGAGKGIPTLYVYLKYGNGAVVVEHSGEILNEAVFDQVVASIKTE